jgi:hypothetical protein
VTHATAIFSFFAGVAAIFWRRSFESDLARRPRGLSVYKETGARTLSAALNGRRRCDDFGGATVLSFGRNRRANAAEKLASESCWIVEETRLELLILRDFL